MNEPEAKQKFLEFIHLIELEEESYNGQLFHPTRIYSCRAVDGANINEILTSLKSWANQPTRKDDVTTHTQQ